MIRRLGFCLILAVNRKLNAGYLVIRGKIYLCLSGTPRSVYISVGANPTRQLTVRAVAKEAESLTGGRKQR